MYQRRIIAALATGTTVLATAVALGGTADAAPATRAIPNTRPTWTAHAQHLGPARSTTMIQARVYLQPKGGIAALRSFALAASTPGTKQYRHFLSAKQYRARFGTTRATASSVSRYVESQGLRVIRVAPYNRYLVVRGTVGSAEHVFGTQLDNYRHQGKVVRAPASTIHVSTKIASSVLTVSGLDTSTYRSKPSHTKPEDSPPGFRNGRPCSTYYGQLKAKYQADFSTPLPKFHGKTLPYAVCGYTGPQLRAAYEGGTTLDGSGVSVGIVDAYASPTIAKDANTYATDHGDGSYRSGQLVQTNASEFKHAAQCGPTGWYGEETLDVEAVHAMAPAANIHFYGGASCYDRDLLDAIATVVNQDKVQLVSNSYGDAGEDVPTGDVVASESVFLQGAAEGISFLFSSGDSGDDLAATGIKQTTYQDSDPYVTAVGGTSTAIGASGTTEFQTGWGTEKYLLSTNGSHWSPLGYLYGAGGGSSTLFNRPSYQDGYTSAATRQVPDVAMDADPTTGMLIGETQAFPEGTHYGEYRIGGTSLASPLFAGLTALTLQAGGGDGAGLLNPLIYDNGKKPKVFSDVKGTPPDAGNVRVDYANGLDASDGLLYSIRTFDQDSSLEVTKGYDQVTGVGVPNLGWLNVLS